MLHSYMFDVEALEYAGKGSDRVEALRRHIDGQLLPGLAASEVIANAEKVWQDDPWAGGAWGWTQPHQMGALYQTMRRPEGRVHFAGEHTSVFIAWMNGAIESGERAAGEIVAANAGT
jgi:monoamine oxidase